MSSPGYSKSETSLVKYALFRMLCRQNAQASKIILAYKKIYRCEAAVNNIIFYCTKLYTKTILKPKLSIKGREDYADCIWAHRLIKCSGRNVVYRRTCLAAWALWFRPSLCRYKYAQVHRDESKPYGSRSCWWRKLCALGKQRTPTVFSKFLSPSTILAFRSLSTLSGRQMSKVVKGKPRLEFYSSNFLGTCVHPSRRARLPQIKTGYPQIWRLP